MKPYTVYLLLCADGSFYTGITTDLTRRLAEHSAGTKGAKYTRSRRPVRLAYSETCSNRSDAQKREYALRTLSASQKRQLSAT